MIMAVMMPRETWTDERLDDLNGKVSDGFARLDADIRELRAELKTQAESLRKEIKSQGDGLRSEMSALQSEMNSRFEAANRNLIGVAVAIVAAIIGSNAF
jgi:DNA anti-recombination protein RmuC